MRRVSVRDALTEGAKLDARVESGAWQKTDEGWASTDGRWRITPQEKRHARTVYQLTDMHRRCSVGIYVTPEEAMDRVSF